MSSAETFNQHIWNTKDGCVKIYVYAKDFSRRRFEKNVVVLFYILSRKHDLTFHASFLLCMKGKKKPKKKKKNKKKKKTT